MLGLGSDFVGDALIHLIAVNQFCYWKHLFAVRFSETPLSCLETFQFKIDHQFKRCALADVGDAYNQVYSRK